MLWRFAACHIFWPLSTCFDHRVIESKQNYRWETGQKTVNSIYCLGVAWNPLCVWCKTTRATSGETFQSLNRTWNYRLYLLCFRRKFQSIVFDITLTCISLNNFKRNKSSTVLTLLELFISNFKIKHWNVLYDMNHVLKKANEQRKVCSRSQPLSKSSFELWTS